MTVEAAGRVLPLEGRSGRPWFAVKVLWGSAWLFCPPYPDQPAKFSKATSGGCNILPLLELNTSQKPPPPPHRGLPSSHSWETRPSLRILSELRRCSEWALLWAIAWCPQKGRPGGRRLSRPDRSP